MGTIDFGDRANKPDLGNVLARTIFILKCVLAKQKSWMILGIAAVGQEPNYCTAAFF